MKNVLKTVGLFALCATSTFTFAQEERSMGMLIDREKDKAVPLIDKPLGFGENLPEKVSLKAYVPKIGDQGNHGTCVGWSSTYYLATMEYAILNNIKHSKELEVNVYDPYYTYLGIVNFANPSSYTTCESGTYTSDACQFLVDNGAKRRSMDKVNCGDDIKTVHNEKNCVVDFESYRRVFNWYDVMEENVTTVCQSLANNHPVVFGMSVPRSFFKIDSDGFWYPTAAERKDPDGTRLGGHAMTIVGYDDNLNGGCFIVVNSWGEDWGDDGFWYLKYEDFQLFTTGAFSFETKLKDISSTEVGCAFGDCDNGYGMERVKKEGTFEGEFANGEMEHGIYINHRKKLFAGGKLFMKKQVKKKGGYLLYEAYDNKKPIGFVLY